MASQTDLDKLTPNVDDDDTGDKPKRETSRKRLPSARAESQLRDRLSGCLDRIAVALETRGDEQLAEIIREDAEIMSVGLVSLTRPFKMLRAPLLFVLAVVEPAMAFGRVARVAIERIAERRNARAQAAQQARDESNESNAY